MENDFIYWRHHTPAGIKIEEICGADDKSAKVWIEMARQIYCEQGKDAYREIGHFSNGAPFLFNEPARISIAHTKGMLVVASLPRTPEAFLGEFSPRTAMGVDVEKADRTQVRNVKDKFLSPSEQLLTGDDLTRLLIAWTAKEALYKAAMTEELPLVESIEIVSLPNLETGEFGKARIHFPEKEGKSVTEDMDLYSYLSEGFIITLAFSPKCSKFMKGTKNK